MNQGDNDKRKEISDAVRKWFYINVGSLPDMVNGKMDDAKRKDFRKEWKSCFAYPPNPLFDHKTISLSESDFKWARDFYAETNLFLGS